MNRKIKNGDRWFDITINILIFLIMLICFYPVYFVFIASFSNPTIVNSGKLLLWPEGFMLQGYKYVLQENRILIGYANSIFYAVLGTLLGLFVCLTAGFSLSRKNLPGKNWILALYVFTMYFGGGLIPSYIIVQKLGLINTRAIIIILGSVSVYNIILIRNYFSTYIPEELYEAAVVDGCSNTRFFTQFAIPLSKAIIAVIALFLMVGYWNSYFTALIYLKDKDKYPLQVFLRQILLKQMDMETGNPQESIEMASAIEVIKYAVIVVSTVPVMCIYPFLQKYFVKGVMIGSLKG